jgi:hypothetical protein
MWLEERNEAHIEEKLWCISVCHSYWSWSSYRVKVVCQARGAEHQG